jgi:3-oxoacid CoA-transferase subunit A
VLSHTCPYKYIPREAFLPEIKQSTVDNSTEEWLDMIEDRLEYSDWYCGHFHIEKYDNKIRFLFYEIIEFGEY